MKIMNAPLRTRVAYFLGLVVFILVSYSLIYYWLLVEVAGATDKTIWDSLQVVVESLTTAGFGGDTEFWNTWSINLFVVIMNLTGVALVFLGFPAFVVPLLRQAVDQQAPRSTQLTDHVIVCSASPSSTIIREYLDNEDISHVLVSDDREAVVELTQEGIEAVYGEPDRMDTLRGANISEARMLVADIDDETNAAIILAAQQLNETLPVVTVATDEEAASRQTYAGATDVIESKTTLAKSLAAKATTFYAEELEAVIGPGWDIDVIEGLVQPNSPLVGRTIREAEVFGRGDTTVIGLWHNGRFVATPDPNTVIRENMILLLVGDEHQIDNSGLKLVPAPRGDVSSVVVCGHGNVGETVSTQLAAVGIDVTTADLDPEAGADIVGDTTRRSLWQRVDLDDTDAVVLVLDDDMAMIGTTLLLEEIAPEIEVIARVNDPDNIWKLYSAGAEYVLSLPTIAGEIIADRVLESETLLTPDTGFEFIRTTVPQFAGQTLRDIEFRNQTGCTIVAIERDSNLIVDIDPDMNIREEDIIVAVGDPNSVAGLRGMVGDERLPQQ